MDTLNLTEKISPKNKKYIQMADRILVKKIKR